MIEYRLQEKETPRGKVTHLLMFDGNKLLKLWELVSALAGDREYVNAFKTIMSKEHEINGQN
jgi:hypothetical protein